MRTSLLASAWAIRTEQQRQVADRGWSLFDVGLLWGAPTWLKYCGYPAIDMLLSTLFYFLFFYLFLSWIVYLFFKYMCYTQLHIKSPCFWTFIVLQWVNPHGHFFGVQGVRQVTLAARPMHSESSAGAQKRLKYHTCLGRLGQMPSQDDELRKLRWFFMELI